METDVMIIGGGPAGLAAAYEVAVRRYKVMIVDEGWALGGQLRQQTQVIDPLPPPFFGQRGFQLAGALVERLKGFPVEYLLNHEFIGLYADGNIGVSNGEKILKIDPQSVIVATGAAEGAIPFPGWTLPGVMTIGAAQILINRERVYPGRTALVVGSSDMALEVSRQMHDVGIKVLGLVESTGQILAQDKRIISSFQETGIPLLLNTVVASATGRGQVEKVLLSTGQDQNLEQAYELDLVCIDGGRHPVLEAFAILNCDFRYQAALGGWLPAYGRDFQATAPGVFVAGQAAGSTCQAGVLLTGALAGIGTVDYLERAATVERESSQQFYWAELERIESAYVPAVWRARKVHLG